VPADLGYYDLRLPEVRELQAEMARYAGIEGFCYYHYWFGNGKRLLERPFNEVLESGKPDFPFCLAWANESWSGIWHGAPGKILIEQTYPGVEDYTKHFYANLTAFFDDRYIKVDEKPIFFVYNPLNLPDINAFLDCWKELASREGLKGFHFVGQSWDEKLAEQILAVGYDAVNTSWKQSIMKKDYTIKYAWNRLADLLAKGKYKLSVWDFTEFATKLSNDLDCNPNYYPTILSGWDNSPRSGRRGTIFINYSPVIFDIHVKEVLRKIENKRHETKIAFLKSWNEWGEGNYVEPDLVYGWDFLDVLKNNLL
jgi:hypothetical protein